MDRLQLLCDIGELNHLFRESISVENFMHRTVEMVAGHMKTDVCSIYIYDDDEQVLVLKATTGLKEKAVDNVTLALGEGLTGQALKELRPICVSNASDQPNYKFFDDIGEEPYDNFLAVPILRGIQRIGVLVLQRKSKNPFNERDITACKGVSSQLANIIENAKFLLTIHVPHEKKAPAASLDDLKFIRGKVASKGFAVSKSLLVDKEHTFAMLMQKHFAEHYGLEDFEAALKTTRNQLETLQKKIEEKLSDAASLIFASHLMILKDHEFVGAMKRLIEEGENPPEAVLKIASEYITIFGSSANTYIREKVHDIEDLTVRLITNLTSQTEPLGNYKDRILIARDLFPSDLLRISSEQAAGIVLVRGGVTSHLSILARSLNLPMVIANEPGLIDLPDGTLVLVDAETGNVYVNPEPDVIESIRHRFERNEQIRAKKPDIKPQTLTADGTEIKLMANINLLSDLSIASELGCAGVGLYRTEFPFIVRSNFPSEQEQVITYSRVIDAMDGKPVTLRTLDIGGDKVLSFFSNTTENNPSLGMRSIRFSLHNREVFAQQIRAMLRAGKEADLKIMFPMISSLDEFMEAKQIVYRCIETLNYENTPHNDAPKVGMMIELPSVIPILPALAEQADFFSIGTNDFIQFMLGADRTNEKVDKYYVSHHPSILWSLNEIISTLNELGKEVSVCGDMASKTEFIPFLLGCGLRILSIDPAVLPQLQQFIATVNIEEARKLARKVLSQSTISATAETLGIAVKNND